MKRYSNVLPLVACLVALAVLPVRAKVVQKPVYIFGYATSLLDSTTYLTDVQRLDSAYVDEKTHFLMDRVLYATQLQFYLEEYTGRKNLTCAVLFAEKKARAEKKLAKVRKKQQALSIVRLVPMPEDDFRFHAEQYIETKTLTPEPEKKQKGDKRQTSDKKKNRK